MKEGIDYIGLGVGGVIINKNNEVLLLLRKTSPESDCWTIPGGSVKFGEKIEDALKREIFEEIGVEIKIIKLLNIVNHIIDSEKTHYVSPEFLVEIISGKPRNSEPEKHGAIKWFSIYVLPPNITMTTKVALDSYKALRIDK